MIGAGEQAIWDLGNASVLAAMAVDGAEVTVTILDRGWDGESRSEQYRIVRTDGGWEAAPAPAEPATAADWTDLLPPVCRLMSPAEIVSATVASPF